MQECFCRDPNSFWGGLCKAQEGFWQGLKGFPLVLEEFRRFFYRFVSILSTPGQPRPYFCGVTPVFPPTTPVYLAGTPVFLGRTPVFLGSTPVFLYHACISENPTPVFTRTKTVFIPYNARIFPYAWQPTLASYPEWRLTDSWQQQGGSD